MGRRNGWRHRLAQTAGDDIDGMAARDEVIKNSSQRKNITERPMSLFVGEMQFRRGIARRDGQIDLPHPCGQVTSRGSEADQERVRTQQNSIGGDVGVDQISGMQEIERRYQLLHNGVDFFLVRGAAWTI